MTSRDLLSPSEAALALYIDFEGGQNLPPSFIGIRTRERADVFEQVVVEHQLFRTLDLPNPRDHGWPKGYVPVDANPSDRVRPHRGSDTFSGMVAALVARAELQERLIVSWSSYEREHIVASSAVSSDLKERFARRWRDAKLTAKAWRKVTRPSAQVERLRGRGRHRLACYMELIDYRIPAHFGDRQASSRIAAVRDQLKNGRPTHNLTAVAKAKWTKVLDYNWHDCNGMREVAIRAAIGLANAGLQDEEVA